MTKKVDRKILLGGVGLLIIILVLGALLLVSFKTKDKEESVNDPNQTENPSGSEMVDDPEMEHGTSSNEPKVDEATDDTAMVGFKESSDGHSSEAYKNQDRLESKEN